MRVVVIGLGVQGYKRRQAAGADFVAAVDPINTEAKYRRIEDVPLGNYDAALACIPDKPKVAVLQFLLGNGKHVLIEKPRWAPEDRDIEVARSATQPTIIALSRILCACATLLGPGGLVQSTAAECFTVTALLVWSAIHSGAIKAPASCQISGPI
jgi:hypothetical protein